MFPFRLPRASAAFLALCAAAPGLQAEVWVVARGYGLPPPGVDFTNIPAAINAASDGDTILVRDGTYSSFAISGKSLTVIADGPDVFLDGTSSAGPGRPSVTVLNLDASQEVLVRGLRTSTGIHVADCEGAVWFDDIRCLASMSPCSSGILPGARVTDSARVTFTRCVLEGEASHDFINFYTGAGSPGLEGTSSAIQLFDSSLRGGAGPDWFTGVTPGPGAPGMRLEASTVTIVGCSIAGGPGGRAQGALCEVVHAPGGPGVLLVGAGNTVRSAESTAVGGVLALEPLCPGQAGPRGPPVSGQGTIVALPGFARHLRANSPVRGGETLTFMLQGQPGEVPLLLVSAIHEPLPLLNGSLLVGLPPTDAFVLPPLPASGQAALGFHVANVGAALGSITLYAQAVFLDPTPALWLGAGTTVVLLDSAF